ncbi:MAG: murein biosynthesis integral membrane protein MurJ [Chitinophagales bacterium]
MGLRDRLLKAAAVISALTILSKILGFAREASLAAVFGATHVTDAYLVGQTVPGLALTAVGTSVGTSFIPVYAKALKERGREGAFALASSTINATLLLAAVLISLGELAAGPLTRLVAPGFQGELLSLTIRLTRIMFPMVLWQVLSGVFTAMLQTEGSFLIPATVGVWLNLVVIGSVVFLGPRFGIEAVAVGTLVAATVQAAVQVPALRKLGYSWRPSLDVRDPSLRRIAQLSLPVLVGSSVLQFGLVVDRMLASHLAEGSIAALNYAVKLMMLVPAVLGTAITTVMYPTLARLSAEGDWRRYSSVFTQTVKVIFFVMTPVAVGMMVLRTPLVRLAFERGAFDHRATAETAWALLFFSIAVAVITLRDLAAQAFYSVQETIAPILVGILAVVVNVIVNLCLVGPLRQGGLALGTSLAVVFSSWTLLWLLGGRLRHVSREECPGIDLRSIANSVWRVVVAAAGMATVVQFVFSRVSALVPGGGVVSQAVRLGAAVASGILSYAVSVVILRVPEVGLVIDVLRSGAAKLRRSLEASPDRPQPGSQ